MDHPDNPDSPKSLSNPEHVSSSEPTRTLDRSTLTFPSPRNPQRPASLNAPRRLYLYTPTHDELIHRSLDLAAQIGIATSRIDREISTDITRDRLRRLFPTAPSLTEN